LNEVNHGALLSLSTVGTVDHDSVGGLESIEDKFFGQHDS